MSYIKDIDRCLSYIEKHLDENITIEALSKEMGYSLYHFCRMFKSIQGVSAAAWIRERRLQLATKALLKGERILDVAITYGFDTHAGFDKAFRKKYGISPTEYIKKGGFLMLKPEILKKEAFSAVCYCFYPEQNEIDTLESGAYWKGKDYSSVSVEEYQKLTYPGYAEVGFWFHPDSCAGNMCYCLGPEVREKRYIPEGMKAVDFPAAEYAVFTVPASEDLEKLAENIRKTWEYIFKEWFDSSDYKYDDTKMDFEYYKGEDSQIWIPVVLK